MKNEFYELVKNGWLTEDDAKKYLSNEKIVSAMELSTSPQKHNIFNALKMVSLNSVKVLILGKDPYPNPKDAHGLAFSSKNDTTPDSLKNIFKAIDKVYGSNLFETGYNDLTNWAKEGVLLLNTGLTYQKITDETLTTKEKNNLQTRIQNENMRIWKPFVNQIVQKILTIKDRPIVMMLWGNDAHNIVFKNIKDKSYQKNLHSREVTIIPNSSIMILQCAHPSPLSVNRGGDFTTIAPKQFIECDKHLGKNKIHWTELK